ncbi:MAG TPA: hypothetical protein PK926_02850 [Spirochaetota bacterium]|nr:hypothetical protein [Spirochaetota bacterium]HPI87981.1 hypothetical protein [Spirochaetota bacterium]HPR46692.1 hypothetical protein [Spirochaetota bacterium]
MNITPIKNIKTKTAKKAAVLCIAFVAVFFAGPDGKSAGAMKYLAKSDDGIFTIYYSPAQGGYEIYGKIDWNRVNANFISVNELSFTADVKNDRTYWSRTVNVKTVEKYCTGCPRDDRVGIWPHHYFEQGDYIAIAESFGNEAQAGLIISYLGNKVGGAFVRGSSNDVIMRMNKSNNFRDSREFSFPAFRGENELVFVAIHPMPVWDEKGKLKEQARKVRITIKRKDTVNPENRVYALKINNISRNTHSGVCRLGFINLSVPGVPSEKPNIHNISYSIHEEKKGSNSFTGTYQKGVRDGYGCSYYSGGKTEYCGDYKDGQKNGSGTQYYQNGAIMFSGTYKNNAMNSGDYYYENGEYARYSDGRVTYDQRQERLDREYQARQEQLARERAAAAERRRQELEEAAAIMGGIAAGLGGYNNYNYNSGSSGGSSSSGRSSSGAWYFKVKYGSEAINGGYSWHYKNAGPYSSQSECNSVRNSCSGSSCCGEISECGYEVYEAVGGCFSK